jgi:hypothetical protein
MANVVTVSLSVCKHRAPKFPVRMQIFSILSITLASVNIVCVIMFFTVACRLSLPCSLRLTSAFSGSYDGKFSWFDLQRVSRAVSCVLAQSKREVRWAAATCKYRHQVCSDKLTMIGINKTCKYAGYEFLNSRWKPHVSSPGGSRFTSVLVLPYVVLQR